MPADQSTMQTGKVAVFVDGANLYHSIKSYYSGMLDYKRLLEAAKSDRRLLRATFYIVEKADRPETDETASARPFVYNLNNFGYKVRSKPLAIHESVTSSGEKTITHKGDWDVGIVVDMFRLARHADTFVLVSGDGDYVEALDVLQSEYGVRVEVISALQCTSQTLLDICDSHTDLSEIPDLFKSRPPKPQETADVTRRA